MLSGIKNYAIGVVAIAGLTLLGWLAWDNHAKGKTIARQTAKIEVQAGVIEAQSENIAKRKADTSNKIKLNTSISEMFKQAYTEVETIDIRSLQNATINKPNLVRTLINDATDSVLQEFHSITNSR